MSPRQRKQWIFSTLTTLTLVVLSVLVIGIRVVDLGCQGDPECFDKGGGGGGGGSYGNPIIVRPKDYYFPPPIPTPSIPANLPPLVDGANHIGSSPVDSHIADQFFLGNLPNMPTTCPNCYAEVTARSAISMNGLLCDESTLAIKDTTGTRGYGTRTNCPSPDDLQNYLNVETHTFGSTPYYHSVTEVAGVVSVKSTSGMSGTPQCESNVKPNGIALENWLVNSATPTQNIDVAILYTPEAKSIDGGMWYLTFQTNIGILLANQALAYSNIHVRLRPVLIQETQANQPVSMPMNETSAGAGNGLLQHLADLGKTFKEVRGDTISGSNPPIPVRNGLRDAYGADLVFLVVKPPLPLVRPTPTASDPNPLPQDPNPCSVTSALPGNPDARSTDAERGFAVISGSWHCMVAQRAFTSALGHLLGVDAASAETQSKTALRPYSHALKSADSSWRTFPLSETSTKFNGQILPHFSNASMTCDGVPIGDPNTADAARSINEAAVNIADYRAPTFDEIIYTVANDASFTTTPDWFARGIVDALDRLNSSGTKKALVLAGRGTYYANILLKDTSIKLQSIAGPAYTFLNGRYNTTDPNPYRRTWIQSGATPGVAVTIKGSDSTVTDSRYFTTKPEISGFTIIGGAGISSAGGIWVQGQAAPTIKNNVFRDNTSSFGPGAALTMQGAAGTVSNNIFYNNQITGTCPTDGRSCPSPTPTVKGGGAIYVKDLCPYPGTQCPASPATVQGSVKISHNILYANKINPATVSSKPGAGILMESAVTTTPKTLKVVVANNTVVGNKYKGANGALGVGIGSQDMYPVVVNNIALANSYGISTDITTAASNITSQSSPTTSFYDTTTPWNTIFAASAAPTIVAAPTWVDSTWYDITAAFKLRDPTSCTNRLHPSPVIDHGTCYLNWSRPFDNITEALDLDHTDTLRNSMLDDLTVNELDPVPTTATNCNTFRNTSDQNTNWAWVYKDIGALEKQTQSISCP